MKTQKSISLIAALLLITVSSPTIVQGYEDDFDTNYEEVNYESLVSELSKTKAPKKTYAPSSSLDDVEMHFGVGMINTNTNIEDTFAQTTKVGEVSTTKLVTKSYSSNNKGIQIGLGIDLFSRNWKSEGTFRNYDDFKTDDCVISLKEFDLKLIYQDRLTTALQVYGGGGIAARYLDIFREKTSEHAEFSTPASVFFLGASVYMSKALSLGAELSRRASMVSETADRDAIDMTIKLDTHF